MSKGKLEKFAEMATFKNVVQPSFEEVFKKEYKLKGKWAKDFFNNSKPITLELGCGKGEYSVGLAKLDPTRNFLGIDIKGNRIWKGAKASITENLKNVGFLRTRIDLVESFFAEDEIQDIWITFPDPQPKKALKRLTSSRFLNKYRNFLSDKGSINLKTDSIELFEYTLSLALFNKLPIDFRTNNLYGSGFDNEVLSIKTFYENIWLTEGKKICYIRFSLLQGQEILEPPDEEE